MPTLMPTDTAAALGPNAENCNSRSLLLERFADPTAKENSRKSIFTRAFNKPVNHAKSTSHAALAASLAGNETIYAQLQSRLMVNMAGGVMENAGLCLDRFGLPYIPGSAVKGCARRAATQALLEAESSEAKADLLFKLCLVFGWGDTDWKAGRKRKRVNGREVETEPLSDFWWTMASETENRAEDDLRRSETWQQVAVPVAKRLLDQLRMHKREHPDEPWRDLPNFGGSISFLPAYPVDLGKTGKVDGLPLEVPPLGKLELDVVTVHHKHYYAEPAEPKDVPHSHERWQRWKRDHEAWEREWGTAPDIEEPVPNVFPAVAPGHVFAFALAPLRRADAALLQHARTWLATGLQTFGLGAKTAAGYGWFTVTETANYLKQTLQKELETLKAASERAQLRANPAILEKLKSMKEADLRGHVNQFHTEEKFWVNKDEEFQLSLLVFCTETNLELYTKEKANPKSRIIKSLQNLATKFGRTLP
jgi:CRISPR/Cas system CMR subunit Cmr6 (Cas7 group RAMP superfamily)